MRAYISPQKNNRKSILVVYDARMVTWLNITDPAVKTTIYKFLECHNDASVVDLISFCVEQSIECGITLDNNTEESILSMYSLESKKEK